MIPHQLPLLADLHFGDDRLPPHFWAKIKIDSDTGCWLWTGARNGPGYGSWGLDGRAQSTHRVSYEMFRGPIPDGLFIDHLCEVKNCCNPAHLEAVTSAENMRRLFASQITCLRGHPLSGPNLKVRSNGQRRCIECRREHSRAYRRRLKVVAA